MVHRSGHVVQHSGKWSTIPVTSKNWTTSHRNRGPLPTGIADHFPPESVDQLRRNPQRLRDEATQPRKPRKGGRGLWADLNIDLSADVIDEARREMWKTFVRDDL